MTGRVVVVGSFMMDLVVQVPRFPHAGETLVGDRFDMRLGGKGYNQAVAARRAGAEVGFVGRLGSDVFADRFAAGMQAEGIDGSGVVRADGTGTGVGLPMVDADAENSIVIVPQANTLLTPADVERSRDLVASADVLLLQLEVPQDAGTAAARIARGAGARVVLNPAPYAPVDPELLRFVDAVVPNETEGRSMAGLAASAPAEQVAEALRDQLGATVLLTLGSRGSLVAEIGGDLYAVPAVPVRAVDSVAAGDTFCGAFAAEVARNAPLGQAVTFATAAAALAVSRVGSADAAPTRAEVLEVVALPR